MTAAILAGGGPDNEVAAASGVPCKALAQVDGRSLIDYVIEALRGARTVDEIVAVEAPSRSLSQSGVLPPDVPVVTARGDELIDTFVTAVEACPNEARVLIVTADLPLLTSEAVDLSLIHI